MKRARPNTKVGKETSAFRVEFHASIEGRRPGFYVLENLAPKYAGNGDDILFYRIRFTEEGGFPHGNYPFDIQLTRIFNPNSKKRLKEAEDEYQEEAFDTTERIHFTVKFPTILHDKVKRVHLKDMQGRPTSFLLLPNYQVEIAGDYKVKAIYFTLENNQLDERNADEPLWHLGLDEATYWMPKVFGNRYQGLDFIHPDPNVPCDRPSHKRPQRSPGWSHHRANLPKRTKSKKHQSILKGRVGGTKSYKFAGFFKNSGLGGPFGSSVIMKLGRIHEMDVAIAYLSHYKNRIVEEVGWFDHPTKPYHGASPDGLITIPGRTFQHYPAWVTNLMGQFKVDVCKANPEKMVLEIKVSQTNAAFKAYYVCQVYQEMIVTNTHCAELVKMCITTNEIKVYRIYRNPVFESLFSECIDRVEKDLLAGKSYRDVVDHSANKSLRSECMKLAMYYNGDQYEPTIIPVSKEVEDFRAWRNVFETEVTEVPVSRRPKKKHKQVKEEPHKRKRESSPPYIEGGATESDLWRDLKRRTVSINKYLKEGNKRSIVDEQLIEQQMDDYKRLLKQLCKG